MVFSKFFIVGELLYQLELKHAVKKKIIFK